MGCARRFVAVLALLAAACADEDGPPKGERAVLSSGDPVVLLEDFSARRAFPAFRTGRP
jgi:hypothetical protein